MPFTRASSGHGDKEEQYRLWLALPDGDSIPRKFNQQVKTPPDKAGWCFYLLVEPGGIEPPSASPLQADLHT
jgi:hypothetical protein